MPFYTDYQRVRSLFFRELGTLWRVLYSNSRSTRAPLHPLLKSLHWLPVQLRIQFKLVAVVTYKVKSTKMPAHLHNLLCKRIPTRTLRSSSRPLLDVTRTKTLYGQQAFHISAPNTWNSLPVDIQLACISTVFKKRL